MGITLLAGGSLVRLSFWRRKTTNAAKQRAARAAAPPTDPAAAPMAVAVAPLLSLARAD